MAVRHFSNAFETDDAEPDSVFALLAVRVEILSHEFRLQHARSESVSSAPVVGAIGPLSHVVSCAHSTFHSVAN